MSKDFPIGAILTVTTGTMLAPFDDIYNILNYMTGDDVFTHQIPRFMTECKPWLLRQHPQLKSVDGSGVNRDNWQEYIKEQSARFGAILPVQPIPADDHVHRCPVEEAVDLFGADRVLIVDSSEGDSE